MKKILLILSAVLFMASCNTRKQVEKAVSAGNYDQAINTALAKLKTNKNKKRKHDYAIMLKDAYKKVVERDLNTISHLKKDTNPEAYKTIYERYVDLNNRQEAIKPILPLVVSGKTIPFTFNNYSNDILDAKEKLSNYMHKKGIDLLESNNKNSIREAHNTLQYLNRINPNYKDTQDLLNEAHARGTDYILVSINNQTEQVIPQRLQEDLLNFDTYGLNKFWSVYHANQDTSLQYDYAMLLNLRQINISPERINEREFIREKDIKDGWEYELDRNGNVAKDSLGNDIKINKIIRIRCKLLETIQTKSSQVIANVVYKDLKTNQTLDAFSIDSAFVFEHIFARYRGDKRALNNNDRNVLNNRQLPFPSNEQMVYDTGEDLKLKLRDIINSYTIRK